MGKEKLKIGNWKLEIFKFVLCKSHFTISCEAFWADSWSLGAGN